MGGRMEEGARSWEDEDGEEEKEKEEEEEEEEEVEVERGMSLAASTFMSRSDAVAQKELMSGS
jgi:hypothetical protein